LPPGAGGGELARDSDADVREIVSDICSLDGVPGGCIDAILGFRDGILTPANDGTSGAAVEGGVGCSFGVDTSRNVLGAGFFARPSTETLGLAGREEIEGVRDRNAFVGVPSSEDGTSSGSSMR